MDAKSIDNEKFVFDKQMTTAIKGVAICIMLFHHFFGFPEWLNEGISIYGIPFRGATIEYYLGVFGKICVATYTVLSGYGLFLSYQHKKKLWDIKYLAKRTLQLLLNWWLIVLLVETPIVLLRESGGITRIIGHLTLIDLSGNPFVEYLRFYLLALWTSPLYYNLILKCKRNKLFILFLPFAGMVLRKILVLTIGSIDIVNIYVLYIPYFLTGMMICKDMIFEKTYAILAKYKIYKGVLCFFVMVIIVGRCLLGNHALSFDSWFATALIFVIAVLLQDTARLKSGFAWLGKYSTDIWYSHAVLIFGGGSMQKILYAPKVPMLILVWGIVLCMPGALIVNWLMGKVLRGLRK